MSSPALEIIFEPRLNQTPPKTSSCLWHTLGKGGAYAGGIALGLGPNAVVAAVALLSPLIKATKTECAIACWEWKKQKLQHLPAHHPKNRQVINTLHCLEGEMEDIKNEAWEIVRLATPILGPIWVANRYIDSTHPRPFLNDKTIEVQTEEGIKSFIKKITFGLDGRYPRWAYENEEAWSTNRPSAKLVDKKRKSLLNLGGKELFIRTEDGRYIEAVYTPGRGASASRKYTALLFHGPWQVIDDLKPWIAFYIDRGIHVLAITVDGYGNNQRDALLNDFAITQKTAELDALAAFNYVKKHSDLENHQILVHGISTLAIMATFLARTIDGIHLVIDQAPLDVEDAALNYIGKLESGKERFVKEYVRRMHPTKLNVFQDVYETEAASFMALTALQDELTGNGDLGPYHCHAYNSSHVLAHAYLVHAKAGGTILQHIINFKGNHGACFADRKLAVAEMEAHLKKIGFLAR